MYSFVNKYVTSCEARQRRKQTNSSPASLLQPLSSRDRAFKRSVIDLFGPLPLSTLNNLQFVAAIDLLTRHVVTTSLPTGSSAKIENVFVKKVLLR